MLYLMLFGCQFYTIMSPPIKFEVFANHTKKTFMRINFTPALQNRLSNVILLLTVKHLFNFCQTDYGK